MANNQNIQENILLYIHKKLPKIIILTNEEAHVHLVNKH